MKCFYFCLALFMIFFSIPSWGMEENQGVCRQLQVSPQKGPRKRSFNPDEENPRKPFDNITNTLNPQNDLNRVPGNPSPPKKFRRCAPKCDTVPIPYSRIPEVCGKWCRTLDYNYGGEPFSTKDWHWEAGCELRQVKGDTNTGNTNFAKCRIETIFHTSNNDETTLERKCYEFPKVFSSRNFGPEYISFPQLFTSQNKNKKIKFVEKLLGSRITNPKDFEKNYYHTENTILRYVLKNSSEWIEAITPKEKPDRKYTLAYFVLTICSYYDSCDNCARTMYGAIDKEFYRSKLNKKLQNYKLPKEDDLGIFINVSSLSAYKVSRRNMTNVINDITLPGFLPCFAQMALNLPPPAPTDLPFIADTPQMTNFSLIDELEKETSERMTEDQDALARSTLFPQWLVNPPDAEEKGGEEKSKLIEFVMAPKIIIPTSTDEEEEDSERIIATQDIPARPNLYLQLYGNTLNDKEKSGEKKSTLSQLAKASSKDDTEVEEKKTFDDPSNILPYLIDSLVFYRLSNGKHVVVKPLFKKAFHKHVTNKVDRDKILAIYLNKNNCIESGTKMPLEAQNTAYLLKTFGWLYLKDNVPVREGPQKKSSDSSIVSKLKKIEADNQENDLSIIARFFRDEIEKHGKFESRNSKYYYKRM
jgi:hypothetical protein